MRFLKILVVTSALFLTPLAFAETFSFYGYAAKYYDGYPGITVDGTFTATPGFEGHANLFEITSVSGYVINPNSSISTITGIVLAPGNLPTTADGFIYDDLYYSSVAAVPNFNPPYPTAHGFDYYGLLFETSNGDYVNLFTNDVSPVGIGPVYADS